MAKISIPSKSVESVHLDQCEGWNLQTSSEWIEAVTGHVPQVAQKGLKYHHFGSFYFELVFVKFGKKFSAPV